MEKQEIKALKDITAFIEFAIEKELPFITTLLNVGHDVHGLVDGINDPMFLPRTHGYSDRK
jgi:hypothetical protein